MECKHCGNTKFYTLDTRKRGDVVERKKMCIECRSVYITTEKIVFTVKFDKREGKEVTVESEVSHA
jgi:transcriptional regulator NrdR family protein